MPSTIVIGTEREKKASMLIFVVLSGTRFAGVCWRSQECEPVWPSGKALGW